MLLLVALALIAYAREGAPLRWDAFRDRYRLSSMELSSWICTLVLATFMFRGPYASVISFISAFVLVGGEFFGNVLNLVKVNAPLVPRPRK